MSTASWREQIDWNDLLGWLALVDTTQTLLDLQINPRVDSELATVEATGGMQRPLERYLCALREAEQALTVLAPWQHYQTQLLRIASMVEPERARATVAKLLDWLGAFGAYVESEQAFVDHEIAKVTGGGYRDELAGRDLRLPPVDRKLIGSDPF
jgi:hypothetical protein